MNFKLLTYLIVFVLASYFAKAQVFVPGQEGMCNNGATMYIRPSTTLTIDGNFYNKQSENPLWVRSNGVIKLTGDLTCDVPLICERASSLTPTSMFIFEPSSPTITIKANTDTLILYHTIINKANTTVRIASGFAIKILDTLDFRAGNILLDSGSIYMRQPQGSPSYVNHPYLKNERHESRIYGNNGFVQTRAVATLSNGITPGSNKYNFANLGLTFQGQSGGGDSVEIKRGHLKQVYAGNGSITRYYNVISKLNLKDTLKISYIDSAEYIGLGINKNNLKLFASPAGDMDYYNLNGTNFLATHSATASINTFSLANINPKYFRVTVADQNCTNPPISALPNGTLNLCSGVTQILDAGNNTSVPSTNLIWSWSTLTNTLATTQTIAVTSNTTTQHFIVTLRDVRGCITKDTVVVAPTAPTPNVNFTLYSKCFGDSVKLKSTSTITSGTIANYNWQFGDATSYNTSLNDTIKKLYASAGKFYVTLTATSNYSCSASKLDSIYAFPLPTANFTNTFNCATGLVEFTSSSLSGFGSIQQNFWNFNTASTSTLTSISTSISPTYSYAAAGTYTVKLLVKTFQGCKDSVTQNITINPKNISAFNVAPNWCLGDTISFVNNSICNTGSCNYVWDFADGTQSIALNPKKIYTASGVYNVKLKMFNASSCTDSLSVAILVNPKPIVSFSGVSVCFGSTSYFTNNTTIPTGSIVAYNWNLGNSSLATSTNVAVTYTNAGNYNVSLSATSNLGCVASVIQNISVFQKPTAQYNVANVCLGQPSVFNQNSIGSSLTYTWNYGNTNTSNLASHSYTYPSTGSYSANLIVSDVNGCSDTSSVNTIINSIPTPNLAGTAGGTITTCGTSYTLNAGLGVNYLWQPSNATSQNITVTSNGIYSVTVTDANGCVGKDYVTVGLNSIVKPQLGNDTTSCGPYFMNAGYPSALSFVWTIGTSTTTVATTQTLLATTSSTYIVTVTDINGCVGKDTVAVLINTPPTLSLGSDITQCKTSQPVVLTPTTSASIYLWNNGTTLSTLNVNNNGSYAVTVTAGNGCKKSDTINIILLPSPIVNLGADVNVCGAKLLDAQNTGFNYLWSTGSILQTISATTNGSYWVQVTNQSNGCVTSDTINLLISTPITLFLGNDTSTCSNNIFTLNAGNAGSTYNWSTGATTQTITTGSTGGYGVTVTNGACSAFDVVNISVLNAPVVNLGNNINYLCGNGFVTLNAGNAGNTINWGSNNGFTSTQSIVSLNQSGTYWVNVSNGACSESDTVQVIQTNQTLNAYFVASTIDTVGKSVKFVDVSQPTPTTWNWDFGDGFYSTSQSPEHIFLTPQTFSVTLTVSNGFCTSQITKSLQVFKLTPHTPKEIATTLSLIDFSIYPNPTDKSFTTHFELNDPANINFMVYDVSGKLVYQLYKHLTSIINEEIDISFLRNGMYLIEITAENQKGFVKQKSKLVIMR